MPIGKIETFDIGSNNWTAYCRRVKQFISLNQIPDNLHVATLVTHVGEKCYDLMCDLCAPDLPESKTFDQLEQIIKVHLEPQRSEIAERHIFRQRKQMQGETVSDYLQSLKHLAKTCNFTNVTSNPLEINLRDQFVSGLHNEDMRSRLFAEKNLDYNRAVELALALEAATRYAMIASSSSSGGGGASAEAAEPLHRVASAHGVRRSPLSRAEPQAAAVSQDFSGSSGARRSCTRCGKEGHTAARCRFKNYSCDRCGKKGHLKVVCSEGVSGTSSGPKNPRGQFFLDDSSEGDLNFYNIVCGDGDAPYYIQLKVENRYITFELDTGSKISVISKSFYDKLLSHIPIKKKCLRLKSYTGTIIEPLGYIIVNVVYKSITEMIELYIVEKGGPPLMGRTWMRCLRLDISNCYNIAKGCDDEIATLRMEFPAVFADGLGTFKTPLRLHLADPTPVYVKARPLPLALREPVERELERLQRDDVIYKVNSSDYGTPIVPVIKKIGEIRICGDYKITINPRIKDFHYPLPRIEDIFATLSGGQQFSKLDLSHAYQQLLLTDDSQPMTAISTHVGTYVYKRVPFGIKCIPEHFQKIIEETLSGLPSTVVWIDDICVTGKDKATHLRNLRLVLSRLNEVGLRVNWSKCEFFKNSVTYLGYRIDKDGLHTDEKKVEAIVAAPTPPNISQLKSFVGLVNFYAKFCVNMSEILKPLYNLLKKNVKWHWSEECKAAFKNIKRKLSRAPMLAHYDPTLPLILSVDSSAYGLGAVLSHRYPDGTERLISSASRTLNDAEQNYSQLDKEALAIVFGVTKHHQYLYGRKFLLRSDHRALSYIFGKNKGIPQTAASRIQRYAIKLAGYNFDIEFVPSTRNCFADFLSRLPTKFLHNLHVCDKSYLNYIEDKLPITFREIKSETHKDPLLNKVLGYIKFGWPQQCANDIEKSFFLKKDNLFLEHGCLVWGYRVIIPESLRVKMLDELHSGHIGVIKMKQLARNYVWWDRIDADIERVCRECSACAAHRPSPPHAPLHTWAWPEEPWCRLNVDFLGPYRNRYYIVLVDAHSKWLEAEAIPSTSATAVISFFRKIFARFGFPKCIVSDNGPPFSSIDIREYLSKNGIKQILVAPYHPSSNGAAENAVRTVKQVLKKATTDNDDLEIALCRFLFSYRNTEHCTTRMEPAVALMGRRLRGRLDLIRPDTSLIVKEAQDNQRSRYGGTPREANVGDQVYIRDYRLGNNNKWTGGVVTKRTVPVSYGDHNTQRRHIDQLITTPTSKSRHSLSMIELGMTPKDVDHAETEEFSGRADESRSTLPALSPSPMPTSVEHAGDSEQSGDEVTKHSIRTRKQRRHNKFQAPHSMTLRPRKDKNIVPQ